jgi:hypothetical protein
MTITNPFTGATLNANVPNPEGCNQHTGPNCGSGSSRSFPKSSEESWKKLSEEAGVPVELLDDLEQYGLIDYEYEPSTDEFVPKKIRVRKHPLARAILAHEVGHASTRPSEGMEDLDMAGIDYSPESEVAAWKWALKNRKRLGVSKKDLRKMIRVSEVNPLTGQKVLDALDPESYPEGEEPELMSYEEYLERKEKGLL